MRILLVMGRWSYVMSLTQVGLPYAEKTRFGFEKRLRLHKYGKHFRNTMLLLVWGCYCDWDHSNLCTPCIEFHSYISDTDTETPGRGSKVLVLLTHWPLGDLNAILKMEFSILFYWLVPLGLLVIFCLRWMPQDLTDDKSTLVQVMAWCHQATSHYLSQCWLSPLSPYGFTRTQWVNICWQHSCKTASKNGFPYLRNNLNR